MRKLSVRQLKRIIKEETDNAVNEQRQAAYRTPAQYIAAGHEDIFLEVTGRLMNWEDLWEDGNFFSTSGDGVNGRTRAMARMLGRPLGYGDVKGSLQQFLTFGGALSDYHDGSAGADVFEALERDDAIDGTFRRIGQRLGFSLVSMNKWLSSNGQ